MPKPTKNIRALQRLLKEQGYNPGAIDNAWGPKTEEALASFLKNNPNRINATIAEYLPKLPLPARAFVDDFITSQLNTLPVGKANYNAITRGDLSSNQLKALQKIVRKNLKEGKTNISYADYGTDFQYGDVGPSASSANILKQLVFSPEYNLKTTLGQADIVTTPTDTLVVDQYNFNEGQGSSIFNPFAWYQTAKDIGMKPSLYTVPRKLASQFGSQEGEGAPVIINTTEYSHGGPAPHPEEIKNYGMLPETTVTHKKFGTKVLDALQLGLDVGGLLPIIGEPLDLLNAAIYGLRGDKLNAALSSAAAIPLIGTSATASKFLNKGKKGLQSLIPKKIQKLAAKKLKDKETKKALTDYYGDATNIGRDNIKYSKASPLTGKQLTSNEIKNIDSAGNEVITRDLLDSKKTDQVKDFINILGSGADDIAARIAKEQQILNHPIQFEKLVQQEIGRLKLNPAFKGNPDSFFRQLAETNAKTQVDALSGLEVYNDLAKVYPSTHFYGPKISNKSPLFHKAEKLSNNAFYRETPFTTAGREANELRNFTGNTSKYPFQPGSMGIGYPYVQNLRDLNRVTSHELGHFIQKPVTPFKGSLIEGVELGKNYKRLPLDISLGKLKLKPDSELAPGLKKSKDYFLTGSDYSERVPFAKELREVLTDEGHMKLITDSKGSYYANVTGEQLAKAYKDLQKNPVSTIIRGGAKGPEVMDHQRLFNIMVPTKKNFEFLAKQMNKLPAIVPGVLGAKFAKDYVQDESSNSYQSGGPTDPPIYNADLLNVSNLLPEVTVTDVAPRNNPQLSFFNRMFPAGQYGNVNKYAKFIDNTPKTLETALSLAPYTGDAIDAAYTVDALSEGNYGDAALYSAGFMLPLIPGKAIKKGIKEIPNLLKVGKRDAKAVDYLNTIRPDALDLRSIQGLTQNLSKGQEVEFMGNLMRMAQRRPNQNFAFNRGSSSISDLIKANKGNPGDYRNIIDVEKKLDSQNMYFDNVSELNKNLNQYGEFGAVLKKIPSTTPGKNIDYVINRGRISNEIPATSKIRRGFDTEKIIAPDFDKPILFTNTSPDPIYNVTNNRKVLDPNALNQHNYLGAQRSDYPQYIQSGSKAFVDQGRLRSSFLQRNFNPRYNPSNSFGDFLNIRTAKLLDKSFEVPNPIDGTFMKFADFKHGGKTMKKINKYAIGGFSYQPDEMSGDTVGILGKTANQLGLKPQSQLKHERKNKLLRVLPAVAGGLLAGPAGFKLGMGAGNLLGGIHNQDLDVGTALTSGMNIFTGAQNISPDSFGAQLLQGLFQNQNQNQGTGAAGMSSVPGANTFNALYGSGINPAMMDPSLAGQGFAMGGRIEAEGGEFYVSDDGIDPVSLGRGNLKEMSDGMFKIGGPSHSSGGVDMSVGEGYIHSKRFLSDPALGKKYNAKNNAQVAENIAKLKKKLEAFGNAKEDVNTKALKMAELDNDLITLEKSGEQYKQMKGIDSAGNKIAAYGMSMGDKKKRKNRATEYDYQSWTTATPSDTTFVGNSSDYSLAMKKANFLARQYADQFGFTPNFSDPVMTQGQDGKYNYYITKERSAEDPAMSGMAYGGRYMPYNDGGDTPPEIPTDFSKYLPEGGIPKSVQYAKYIPAIANLFAPKSDPIVVDRPVNKMERMDFNPLLERYLKSIGDSEANLMREIGQSGVTGGRGLASKIAVGAKSDRQRGKAYENISQLALRDKSMMDRLGFGYDKLDSQLGLQELKFNLAQEQMDAAQKAKGLQQFSTNLQTDFWDPIKFSATGTTNFDQMGLQRQVYDYLSQLNTPSVSAMGGPTSYIDSYYTNILNER